MMAILLVGLPGSGKTYLAEHKYVPDGYVLVDDPKHPDDLRVGLARAIRDRARGIVLTDPNLTQPGNIGKAINKLNELGFKAVSVEYFENNWRKASRNLLFRKEEEGEDREHINVQHFSQMYKIPEGVAPIPIYERTEL